MTREKHDQFAKDLFRAVLEPIGDVTAGKEVMSEPLKIDVTFQASSPLNERDLDAFGLPGRLISTTAYFEPYRHSLELDHIWNGTAKLSASWLAARRKVESTAEVHEGALWIVTPSAPKDLLSGSGLHPLWMNDGRTWWTDRTWPTGLYQVGKYLPLGVVVVDELPEERQTLTLRLLGRGRTLKRALSELKNLAPGDPLRTPVLHLLEKWHIIGIPSVELDPHELEVAMHAKMTYAEWSEERRLEGLEEGLRRGREEGMEQGRQEGLERGIERGIERGRLAASKEALLRFWPRLYGDMPETLRTEIEASSDAHLLDAAMNVLAQAPTSEEATQRIRLLLER